MHHLRAILRLTAFVLWSSALWFVALLRFPLALVSRAAALRLQDGIVIVWARVCCALLGIRVEVAGPPPEAPFILVCNHVSYVDIVVLMSCRPVVFVAKSEVARWPFLGRLARAANTIFVDRGRRADVFRVNGLIRGILEQGRGVLVFPEGTSSRGADVLPFRSSLLEPAVEIGHPVSFASLSYRSPPGWPAADQSICWWGDMTFPSHFYRLLQLPHMNASLRFGETALLADDRHRLAEQLRRAVAHQFTPSTQSPPPLAP